MLSHFIIDILRNRWKEETPLVPIGLLHTKPQQLGCGMIDDSNKCWGHVSHSDLPSVCCRHMSKLSLIREWSLMARKRCGQFVRLRDWNVFSLWRVWRRGRRGSTHPTVVRVIRPHQKESRKDQEPAGLSWNIPTYRQTNTADWSPSQRSRPGRRMWGRPLPPTTSAGPALCKPATRSSGGRRRRRKSYLIESVDEALQTGEMSDEFEDPHDSHDPDKPHYLTSFPHDLEILEMLVSVLFVVIMYYLKPPYHQVQHEGNYCEKVN